MSIIKIRILIFIVSIPSLIPTALHWGLVSCSRSLSESDGQVMPTYLAQFVTLRRQLVLFTHVSSRTPYVDPVLRRRPALASGSVR